MAFECLFSSSLCVLLRIYRGKLMVISIMWRLAYEKYLKGKGKYVNENLIGKNSFEHF
jgi:hypothetical protein